jgi:LytS/YehU family sensor histidine kinase
MTLVENSFKHGVSKTIEKSWIHIELKSEEAALFFRIKNSKNKENKSRPGTSSGVGLQNLRNRLGLIYKENHSMLVEEDESSYGVDLHIKTYIES